MISKPLKLCAQTVILIQDCNLIRLMNIGGCLTEIGADLVRQKIDLIFILLRIKIERGWLNYYQT